MTDPIMWRGLLDHGTPNRHRVSIDPLCSPGAPLEKWGYAPLGREFSPPFILIREGEFESWTVTERRRNQR